jgi:hypothetical protein
VEEVHGLILWVERWQREVSMAEPQLAGCREQI